MTRIHSFVGLLGALLPALSMAQAPSPLLQAMVGTWSVEQRMWTGPGTPAVDLPRAVAQRRLVDGKYLEESMRPAEGEAGSAGYFVRNAVLNHNPVNRRYEYFSIDTRAPQAMNEVSRPGAAAPSGTALSLSGGSFVAPEWGPARNVRFGYRLTISAVEGDRQTIGLHLTPQSVLPKVEFLAFEYRYARTP